MNGKIKRWTCNTSFVFCHDFKGWEESPGCKTPFLQLLLATSKIPFLPPQLATSISQCCDSDQKVAVFRTSQGLCALSHFPWEVLDCIVFFLYYCFLSSSRFMHNFYLFNGMIMGMMMYSLLFFIFRYLRINISF